MILLLIELNKTSCIYRMSMLFYTSITNVFMIDEVVFESCVEDLIVAIINSIIIHNMELWTKHKKPTL